MKNKAFTLVESMIVLLIIGMLSLIGAIGYGKVARQKVLQLAATRIGTETSTTRDYSIFGKEIDGNFPCGYGVALKKNTNINGEIKEVFTSGDKFDRVKAMEGDQSCDELIKDTPAVALDESPLTDSTNLSLGKATVEEMHLFQNGEENDVATGGEPNCLVLIFSAPRGRAYYCTDDGLSDCPPAQCQFNVFTEGATTGSNLFKASLKLEEGSSTDRSCISLYPSGNSQTVSDIEDSASCFSN
jgi:prepilin-type N-terminal cleavage/methylation domain-containing protein